MSSTTSHLPSGVPNTASTAKKKNSTASPRPKSEFPPANCVTVNTTAVSWAGAAQGVPVWCVWNHSVDSHGRNVSPPTTSATTPKRAARWYGPFQAHHAMPRASTAVEYRAQ